MKGFLSISVPVFCVQDIKRASVDDNLGIVCTSDDEIFCLCQFNMFCHGISNHDSGHLWCRVCIPYDCFISSYGASSWVVWVSNVSTSCWTMISLCANASGISFYL